MGVSGVTTGTVEHSARVESWNTRELETLNTGNIEQQQTQNRGHLKSALLCNMPKGIEIDTAAPPQTAR